MSLWISQIRYEAITKRVSKLMIKHNETYTCVYGKEVYNQNSEVQIK